MRERMEPKQEQGLIVENASPDDAAGIAHVRNETWLDTYPDKGAGVTREDILSKKFESEDQVARWRKSIEGGSGARKLWVARDKEIVVGYSQGKKGEEENEIVGLYVLPDYQGKGLGGKLLKAALDWLGDEKPVALTVASYSPAVQVYKKFGFIETNEPVSGPMFDSGVSIPTIKMIKSK